MNTRRGNYRILNILIVLGLLVSAIAPYCVYKTSSKILIEICSSNGLELVALGDNENPPQDGSANKKNCSYCISTHMGKIVSAYVPEFIALRLVHNDTIVISHDQVALPVFAGRYNPRAPPVLS